MQIRLTTPEAEVEIAPLVGASVLSYRLHNGIDIFRPAPAVVWDPFSTACFPMIPWCNRLSGGMVDLQGGHHKISPAHPAHPLPIHGSAALKSWQVVEGGADHVHLSVTCTDPAPFNYKADIRYRLTGGDLSVRIRTTNLADRALPYGLGLHPWFPRRGKVALQAPASHFQTKDAQMLPSGEAAVADKPDWDFNELALLPRDLIDTGFGGWNGAAVIGRDDGWGVEIRTDPILECYQVYSPGDDADFFCFEPVSHPINAHNMDGHPGLWPLESGASASITFTFAPLPDMLSGSASP